MTSVAIYIYQSIILLQTELSLSKSLSYYLEAGHWFISLYNDDSEPRQVSCILISDICLFSSICQVFVLSGSSFNIIQRDIHLFTLSTALFNVISISFLAGRPPSHSTSAWHFPGWFVSGLGLGLEDYVPSLF